MSFDQITNSDYAPKSKEILIKSGDKNLKFTASELTYTQRVKMAAIKEEDDMFLQWVVLAITDEDGKHMSIAQAKSLPDEIMGKFLTAAIEVSGALPEKGKKKVAAKRKKAKRK